jgi:rRNA maturation endonuclease Nob1
MTGVSSWILIFCQNIVLNYLKVEEYITYNWVQKCTGCSQKMSLQCSMDQFECKAPGDKVHQCNFMLRTWSQEP